MSGLTRFGNTAGESGWAPGRWPSLLTICDEWLPTKGGISRFNRSWAIAAAASGHRITCLVESASPSEFDDAAEHGVNLVAAEGTPAGPKIFIPAGAVLAASPDVVIGHDIISGAAAWVYAKKYLRVLLVHIVHTAPSENEPYKRPEEATRRTEERESQTRAIAACADLVAAVGPRLARRAEALVGDGFGAVSVLRLDPGMDVAAGGVERRRRVPVNPTVLLLGRTAHLEPKGLDIAARAVAGVQVPHGRPLPDLLVRGAVGDRCAGLRQELVAQSQLARDRIDVRPFTSSVAEIQHDLMRSAVCLMPSRAEGFGLAALEAIGMGTPVLVSARSGLAETLRDQLGSIAEPMIVDVTDDLSADVPRWIAAIQRVLDDLSKAFEYAHEVRRRLSTVLRWELTVTALTDRLAIPAQRSAS